MAHADATYVRLKPPGAALVGLRLCLWAHDVAEPVTGYVRTFRDPSRAAALVAKWPPRRQQPARWGPSVRLLPGGVTVLFQFPNDASLRGLHAIVRMNKLTRTRLDLPDIGSSG